MRPRGGPATKVSDAELFCLLLKEQDEPLEGLVAGQIANGRTPGLR